MKIYVATGNTHKKQEFQALFPNDQIVIPSDEEIDFAPIENGSSFSENSLIKAKALYDIVNCPVIADDSGICVDILDGKPGIFSARYTGNNTFSDEKLPDSERNILLLQEAEQSRKAKGISQDTPLTCRFVCAMVLYLGKERFFTVQETVEGVLVSSIENAKGSGGFGYDPVVYLPEFGKTIAELTADQKNQVSHRGKAAKTLQKFLSVIKSE